MKAPFFSLGSFVSCQVAVTHRQNTRRPHRRKVHPSRLISSHLLPSPPLWCSAVFLFCFSSTCLRSLFFHFCLSFLFSPPVHEFGQTLQCNAHRPRVQYMTTSTAFSDRVNASTHIHLTCALGAMMNTGDSLKPTTVERTLVTLLITSVQDGRPAATAAAGDDTCAERDANDLTRAGSCTTKFGSQALHR